MDPLVEDWMHPVGLTLSEMILDKPLTFDISGYKLKRNPDVEKYVI